MRKQHESIKPRIERRVDRHNGVTVYEVEKY
jgi:hypothetical protein